MTDRAKELLRQGREAWQPTAQQKDALRKKLVLAAATAGAASAATLTASTAKASWLGSLAGWKAVVGVATIAAVTSVATPFVISRMKPAEQAQSATPARQARAHRTDSEPRAAASSALAVTAPTPLPSPSIAPALALEPTTSPANPSALPEPLVAHETTADTTAAHEGAQRRSAAGARTSATAGLPRDLGPEASALLRANTALRQGDSRMALRIADAQPTLFPRAQLREEWLALRAMALCRAGDHARADAVRRQFAQRFPSSIHLVRIARACESHDDAQR